VKKGKKIEYSLSEFKKASLSRIISEQQHSVEIRHSPKTTKPLTGDTRCSRWRKQKVTGEDTGGRCND